MFDSRKAVNMEDEVNGAYIQSNAMSPTDIEGNWKVKINEYKWDECDTVKFFTKETFNRTQNQEVNNILLRERGTILETQEDDDANIAVIGFQEELGINGEYIKFEAKNNVYYWKCTTSESILRFYCKFGNWMFDTRKGVYHDNTCDAYVQSDAKSPLTITDEVTWKYKVKREWFLCDDVTIMPIITQRTLSRDDSVL
eukprot:UN31922